MDDLKKFFCELYFQGKEHCKTACHQCKKIEKEVVEDSKDTK